MAPGGENIARVPSVYAGIFREKAGDFRFFVSNDWQKVIQTNNAYRAEVGKNWTLVSVHSQEDNGLDTWFCAVWNPLPGESFVGRWSSWKEFIQRNEAEKGKKRLLGFDVGSSGGGRCW
jgi:hypothetical protein